MCGIAGISGRHFNKQLVPSMLELMKHRGPDSQGCFLSDKVHLGHCRLSIIDLSRRATQPFVSREHNVAVAVNGEIYNFRELRTDLEAKGYLFQSDSDSETVLHAYIEHGLNFIEKLNGMFAFAIWDGSLSSLFLARDRAGIKPLYYADADKAFLFASEIKALALHEDLDLTLDLQSFAEYLAFENYFSNRTLNKNIKMVEPGEIVQFSFDDNSITRKYYWRARMKSPADSPGETVYGAYLNTLGSSVERHLLSDVPVGCYLSAGIDSSSVAYWSARNYGSHLRTFTGSFGMQGFYDEATAAAQISAQYGCTNCRTEIAPGDFEQNIETILWHLDEPKVGMGSFSQYMVARRAAEEVKVILTGHGGDEFFAGYPVFKAIFGKQNVTRLVARSSPRELMFAVYFTLFPKIRKEAGYFLPNIFSLKSMKSILTPDFHQTLSRNSDIFREPEALKNECTDDYERLTLTYLRYYLPSLFNVEDKISMAFSLESRTPLCDNEMLDLALSTPLSTKLTNYELKHIPRTAMKGKLPDFIYTLPKRGFPTPLKQWFRKELKDYIKNMILDNINEPGIFNRKEAERTITKFQNASVPTPYDEITAHKLWVLLNMALYFQYQKKRYRQQ